MLDIGRDGLGFDADRERRRSISGTEIVAVVIAAAVVLALVW